MEPYIVTKMDAVLGILVFCIFAAIFEYSLYKRRKAAEQWKKEMRDLIKTVEKR